MRPISATFLLHSSQKIKESIHINNTLNELTSFFTLSDIQLLRFDHNYSWVALIYFKFWSKKNNL